VLTCRRRRLRSGATTAEAATSQYLARIDALDGRYGAFEYVDREGALASARELDARLAGGGGEDLGPLMGVPVAVKDLCVVEGMPLTAGSSLPPEVLREIVTGGGAEGSVVRSLRYDVRGMASSLARLRVAGRCSIRVVALREACACHARCWVPGWRGAGLTHGEAGCRPDTQRGGLRHPRQDQDGRVGLLAHGCKWQCLSGVVGRGGCRHAGMMRCG
jgi:hypothetical protein